MNDTENGTDIVEYTTDNQEFLARVLAHGDAEARGYVLAVLAHGGTVREVEAVQEELESIKKELAH